MLATVGSRDHALVRQVEQFTKQREGCQKAGNVRGEVVALSNLTNVHLLLADLQQALETSTAARNLCKKTRDMESELAQILICGHVHVALGEVDQARSLVAEGRAIVDKAGEAKFADGGRLAVNSLAIAASALAGFSPGQNAVVPAALAALAQVEVAHSNYEVALPAAKQALDGFEAIGERRGAASAALALAEAHVQAGIAEDRVRQKMFLPMATHHAGAAGRSAQQAKALFAALGVQEGVAAAQAILDLERVQKCLHASKQPFSYETWKTVND